MWEDIGSLDEAQHLYQGLSAENGRWKTYLANVLLDGRGQRRAALELYREACAATTEWGAHAVHTNSLYGCGVCADSLGLEDEAARCHRRVLDLDPTEASAAFHLLVNTERRSGDVCAEMREQFSELLPLYKLEGWDYARRHRELAWTNHLYTHGLLHLALDNLAPQLDDGLVLEFGVYFGKTLRMIANKLPATTVHGFDTFTGLPTDWHHEGKGSYSAGGVLPAAPPNVQYHVGTFAETLPSFLESTSAPVRFMNVDCDLYVSTKSIFDVLHERIVPGTVIVFDEYIMTSRWKDDEFLAFQEAVAEHGWQYEYLGISLVSGQTAMRITATA